MPVPALAMLLASKGMDLLLNEVNKEQPSSNQELPLPEKLQSGVSAPANQQEYGFRMEKGGMTNPIINIEKGEIGINFDGKVVEDYTDNRFSPHSVHGKDPANNIIATTADFIIPKKYAKQYKEGDDITRRSIVRNVAKEAGSPTYVNKKGGLVPKYEGGGGTPQSKSEKVEYANWLAKQRPDMPMDTVAKYANAHFDSLASPTGTQPFIMDTDGKMLTYPEFYGTRSARMKAGEKGVSVGEWTKLRDEALKSYYSPKMKKGGMVPKYGEGGPIKLPNGRELNLEDISKKGDKWYFVNTAGNTEEITHPKTITFLNKQLVSDANGKLSVRDVSSWGPGSNGKSFAESNMPTKRDYTYEPSVVDTPLGDNDVPVGFKDYTDQSQSSFTEALNTGAGTASTEVAPTVGGGTKQPSTLPPVYSDPVGFTRSSLLDANNPDIPKFEKSARQNDIESFIAGTNQGKDASQIAGDLTTIGNAGLPTNEASNSTVEPLVGGGTKFGAGAIGNALLSYAPSLFNAITAFQPVAKFNPIYNPNEGQALDILSKRQIDDEAIQNQISAHRALADRNATTGASSSGALHQRLRQNYVTATNLAAQSKQQTSAINQGYKGDYASALGNFGQQRAQADFQNRALNVGTRANRTQFLGSAISGLSAAYQNERNNNLMQGLIDKTYPEFYNIKNR